MRSRATPSKSDVMPSKIDPRRFATSVRCPADLAGVGIIVISMEDRP